MLRPYPEDSGFTRMTNHPALQWILDMTKATGRSVRWKRSLAEFNFKIFHGRGKYHKAADGMSRLSQKASEKQKENKNVDDDILEDCFVRKISK